MIGAAAFLLVNHNNEGSNIHGVFDSREKAEAAAADFNARGAAKWCEGFDGDERTKQERFWVWWSSVKVEEWTMNTTSNDRQAAIDARDGRS